MKVIIYVALVAVIAVLWCVSASEPTDRQEQAARNAGLRSPRVVGRVDMLLSPCGCGDSWATSYQVEGTNASGERVTAYVCCGLVAKGCTVRW